MWNPDIPVVDGDLHRRFMRAAYDLAWMYSDDESTKTGAVIIKDDLIVGAGWNHFKPGVVVTPELLADSKWKRDNITHSERAALDDAIAHGVNPRGLVMYMPWVPCKPCAIDIAEAGITALYGHKQMIIRSPDDWIPSLQDALDHLEKNKVSSYVLDGKLGEADEIDACFRKVKWKP